MYWNSKEIIENLSNDLETLPLAHNTCYNFFENILDERAFRPKHSEIDEVYETNKIFFFYGIPAYIDEEHQWPSIFVFDYKDESFFNDLDWSPIDSGAYKKIKDESIFNCFKTVTSKKFKKDFVIKRGTKRDNILCYLKSHIKYFFNNNTNYYQGNFSFSEKASEHSEFSTIKNLFTSINSYDKIKIKKEILEEFVEIDKRSRILEGSTDIDIPISMLKLVACYIPKDKKKEIEKYFNIDKSNSNNIIETYIPSEIGNSNDSIQKKGMKWIEERIEERLNKNNFE